MIQKGAIVSAYALDGKGLAAALAKMAFGNKLGVTVDTDVTTDTLFAPGFGNIVAEVPAGKTAEVYEALHNAGLSANVKRAGAVNEEAAFICGDMKLAIDEALKMCIRDRRGGRDHICG